jgi:LytR cell envelope-related transcriptional attenuator
MSFARVRALAVVGLLVVVAAVFVTIALVKDRQSGPSVAQGCAKDAVVANLKLPIPEQVTLNVYNATDKSGLATNVKNEFVNRKFKVDQARDDPQKKKVDGVATIRYGPKAAGAAWLMRAYFLDEAKLEFDKGRQDDRVDIVIGPRFRQLATLTEVNQALAQLGNPTLPEGTCAGDE